jgi:excisionase family DNA binding protein
MSAVDTVSYVTYADAARRLGVSRSAVWKLVALGRLATVEYGGRKYVPLSAVRERTAKRARSHERTWRRTRGKG